MQSYRTTPLTIAPGQSRLSLDFCASSASAGRFYASLPASGEWRRPPARPAHWREVVQLLAAQNPQPGAAASLRALEQGAGVMATGQQTVLFGGPLYTPLKAATAVARARQATAAGAPSAPLFWLASEDHDFAEISHVVLPGKRELRRLHYAGRPSVAAPVGGLVIGEPMEPLLDELWELLGPSETTELLVHSYRPGRTWAEAFADFYRQVFAAQGLLLFDPNCREAHRLGAFVLRAGIERADELHAALVERGAALEASGYHTQVAVGPESSLLFLVDERSGERQALKRQPATPAEPHGLWRAGARTLSTDELLGVLDSAPERISPSALLRPLFQDYLFGTSAILGGPAEIAYFAQSAVLYERVLGRQTPALARFSALFVEPEAAALLAKHELTLEEFLAESEDSLRQRLAERAMPAEGRARIAAAGEALDQELAAAQAWMSAQSAELGRAAQISANKMRYQMGRLRRLAANHQLQREASLARDASALQRSLRPGGLQQERVVGAAFYFARYGFGLAESMVQSAEAEPSGRAAIWL